MINGAQALYIGGKRVFTGAADSIVNPYSGAMVGAVCVGADAEMEAALSAAFAARAAFAQMTNAARGAALEKIQDGLAARQESIAQTLCAESAKPIRDARAEVGRAIHTFQIAAEEARRFGGGEMIPLDRTASSAGRIGITRRFPAGVVGAITPFNFPLNLVAHKVAPALAVGNPIVLKPAPQTPLTAFVLAEIIADAGLPPGSFNVIHCEPTLGERLATDPRVAVLSFTGSGHVGWDLKAKANRKRVILELGGNAAVVVHDDADIAEAAARCVTGAFSYAGQICISVQRIYVHERVYAPFVEQMAAGAAMLRRGDPSVEDTEIGPLISEAAAQRAEQWVREALEAGARLLQGDGKANGRNFAPTILTQTNDTMKISCEEVFAPIVTVTPYTDFTEALAQVNNSDFGMQAGVFTQDIDRLYQAYRTLEVGGVIANDIPLYRVDHMPYGGVKGSGFGREGVRYAMEEMSELRLLALNFKG